MNQNDNPPMITTAPNVPVIAFTMTGRTLTTSMPLRRRNDHRRTNLLDCDEVATELEKTGGQSPGGMRNPTNPAAAL